jgi:hypothetical protein
MGLGLGLEPAEMDVMARPPRRPDAPIFDRPAVAHVGWMGVFICAGALLLAGAWHRSGWGRGEWQTVLFSAIGFAQVGQAWGLRAMTGRTFRFAATRAGRAHARDAGAPAGGGLRPRPRPRVPSAALSPAGFAATADSARSRSAWSASTGPPQPELAAANFSNAASALR